MLNIFKDRTELSKTVADLFIEKANEAIEERGQFNVALTGGSSPVELYKLLADSFYAQQVPWNQVYVFWGDERYVPLTDEKSNAKMAFETLLNHVPIPKENIFPMWEEGVEPKVFASKYEELLKKHFGSDKPSFDLILLGMGDDGHTASLFPGEEVLKENEKLVVGYYLKPQHMYRITLTAPIINLAKCICFITFGANKAKALSEVLEGKHDPTIYPSQLIKKDKEKVMWFVDSAAASMLKPSN